MKRWIWVLVPALLLSLYAGCSKKEETLQAQKEEAKGEQLRPYDETADAHQDIQRAIERASMTNKRILLIFGANWCPWCVALHKLFETNEQIHSYLQKHFEVVLIDVGKKDKNLDLNEKYGNPIQNGIPVIVVLDSNGEFLAVQETGSLEKPVKEGEEKGHDPEKVMQFLRKWGERPQSS
jgi:thioredoxin-related protein